MVAKPRIAISMGDPGGVGLEVALAAWMRPQVQEQLSAVLVGDVALAREVAAGLGVGKRVSIEPVDSLTTGFALAAAGEGAVLPVYQPFRELDGFVRGAVSAANGRAAYMCVEAAARGVLAGEADGMCTAPLSKEAIYKAGYNFPGHTELLAEISGGVPVRMMMAGGGLRVVLQTIHVALRDVPDLLTEDSILESLRMCHQWGVMYGDSGRAPRIAVCGLNPHAGENGHFGREDLDIIAPAIQRAQASGVEAFGPVPADTVFFRALEGDADIVLAMYHDQALIPVKTLDFHGGVNITVGLPIIRTSPDHGTAFDLAGKFAARADSMAAAMLESARQVKCRAKTL